MSLMVGEAMREIENCCHSAERYFCFPHPFEYSQSVMDVVGFSFCPDHRPDWWESRCFLRAPSGGYIAIKGKKTVNQITAGAQYGRHILIQSVDSTVGYPAAVGCVQFIAVFHKFLVTSGR